MESGSTENYIPFLWVALCKIVLLRLSIKAQGQPQAGDFFIPLEQHAGTPVRKFIPDDERNRTKNAY
jgi:hypothetical protein